MALLEMKEVTQRFGGLIALTDFSIAVEDHTLVGLIGPNGAGKTTVFNCISGFYQPSGGSVVLDGQSIAGHSSHQVANHGVVRTFQNVRLFKSMTALENLLVAQHRQSRATLLGGLFNTPGYRRAEQEKIDNALQWLDVMGLRQFANREAGNLAYGHQRRLEIARCMITKPRVLMLDEPAAGLNPQEKKDLQHLIDDLRKQYGVAVLLIEHDMGLVMGVSERILVMEYGKPIAMGLPEAIRNDERVIKAYLGEA